MHVVVFLWVFFLIMSPRAHCICIPYVRFKTQWRYVLKHTYGMHNVCNVRMPHIISSIGIGIAAADSTGRLHGIGLTLQIKLLTFAHCSLYANYTMSCTSFACRAMEQPSRYPVFQFRPDFKNLNPVYLNWKKSWASVRSPRAAVNELTSN